MRHVIAVRRRALGSVLGAAILASCAGPERAVAPPRSPAPPLATEGAQSNTVHVRAGTSIQAAVNAVGAGGTVLIDPGVYAEAVVVNVPGVRLLGLGEPGGVVITNPGGATVGIRVRSAGDGFELDNVTVRGFDRNGVFLIGVDGFRLSRVRAEDDHEYGIFPVLSSHGVIENCTATGAADTGIYVGQSSDIVVRTSAAWGNVAGFELENTTRVSVLESVAHHNTVGVLVSLVPGVQVMTAADNVVAQNRIYDNNLPNFGDPDDLAGLLPTGAGIIVVGPDRTTITRNTITGNHSAGVAVVSALILTQLAGLPPDAYGEVDPNPDGTRVQLNVVLGNGTDPQPPLSLLFPGVDLLWDGSGVRNCWSQNRFNSSFPSPLPACR